MESPEGREAINSLIQDYNKYVENGQKGEVPLGSPLRAFLDLPLTVDEKEGIANVVNHNFLQSIFGES